MTPIELANVLRLAGNYREASWNGERQRYTTDWYDAAVRALNELNQPIEFARPISVMLYPEYADVWEWVDEMIGVAPCTPII